MAKSERAAPNNNLHQTGKDPAGEKDERATMEEEKIEYAVITTSSRIHASGTTAFFTLQEAQDYLEMLNKKKVCGYHRIEEREYKEPEPLVCERADSFNLPIGLPVIPISPASHWKSRR